MPRNRARHVATSAAHADDGRMSVGTLLRDAALLSCPPTCPLCGITLIPPIPSLKFNLEEIIRTELGSLSASSFAHNTLLPPRLRPMRPHRLPLLAQPVVNVGSHLRDAALHNCPPTCPLCGITLIPPIPSLNFNLEEIIRTELDSLSASSFAHNTLLPPCLRPM
jgi:hypothetical protein